MRCGTGASMHKMNTFG